MSTYEKKKKRKSKAGASWAVCVIVLIFFWDFIVRALTHRNRTKFLSACSRDLLCQFRISDKRKILRETYVYLVRKVCAKKDMSRIRVNVWNGLKRNNKKKYWHHNFSTNDKNKENSRIFFYLYLSTYDMSNINF